MLHGRAAIGANGWHSETSDYLYVDDSMDRLANVVADTVLTRLLPQLSRLESRFSTLSGPRSSGSRKDVGDLWYKRGVSLERHASAAGSVADLCRADTQEERWTDDVAHAHASSRAVFRGVKDGGDYLIMGVDGESRPSSAGSHYSEDEDPTTLMDRCAVCITLQEPSRSGLLADLVTSSLFSKLSLTVIVLNTVYLWTVTNYTSTHRKHELPEQMLRVEEVFIAYFFCELVLRLCVHRLYFFWNEDWGWNIFDMLVVCFGVWDVVLEWYWRSTHGSLNITILRVVRILRVTRIFQTCRAFKFLSELQVMMQCVLGSIFSLFWACVFLLVILMISALIVVQHVTNYRIDHPECHETCENMRLWFGSVATAMLRLFMSTTGGMSWGDLYAAVELCGPGVSLFIICYTVFFQFAFFNIVTSIFVDKAMKLAKPDHEDLFVQRQQEEAQMAQMLRDLFHEVDSDASGVISIDELREASLDGRVLHKFEMLGITVRDVHTFFSTLTAMAHSEAIGVETFVDGCLKMKGPASSLDVQAIGCQVQDVLTDVRKLKRRSAETPVGSAGLARCVR